MDRTNKRPSQWIHDLNFPDSPIRARHGSDDSDFSPFSSPRLVVNLDGKVTFFEISNPVQPFCPWCQLWHDLSLETSPKMSLDLHLESQSSG